MKTLKKDANESFSGMRVAKGGGLYALARNDMKVGGGFAIR